MLVLCGSSRRLSRADDTFSAKRCLIWFGQYTTPAEPETLGPDTMERFCEDIGVEPENVVMLVLAYKMGARQMGYFTQAEWLKGMTELQCDAAAKMPAKLDAMRASLSDYGSFKGVYRYAYDFARVSFVRLSFAGKASLHFWRCMKCPQIVYVCVVCICLTDFVQCAQDKDQRSMDIETARLMLQLLLGRLWPLHPEFARFLDQSKYKVINKDQWCNILEFSRTIAHDLANYDIDGACECVGFADVSFSGIKGDTRYYKANIRL